MERRREGGREKEREGEKSSVPPHLAAGDTGKWQHPLIKTTK